MKATLVFSSVSGNAFAKEVVLNGVASTDHAAEVGYGMVGALSIAASRPLYLSAVKIDARNFRYCATPSYWREGVEIT